MASIKRMIQVLAVTSLASAMQAGSAASPAAGGPAGGVLGLAMADAANSSSLVIHLEQRKGEATVPTRPDHVFEKGDVVRFRLTSGFDGYLYVVDLGSSGSFTTLFPAAGTTHDNGVQKGVDALVPSIGDGWFEIDGPAGFDVVYFLVSSTRLDVGAGKGTKGSAPPAAPEELPNGLKPRCNDEIFKARGECVDDSAGPASLARDVPLPPQISLAAPNISRDIVFDSGEGDTAVKATAPSDKPVVYTFRLAHH